MQASIFPRCRMIPGSLSRISISFSPKPADGVRVETGEDLAEPVPLLQDRQPRESGLESFEAHPLEQPGLFVDGHAPFSVVVVKQGRITVRPRGPCQPVLADHDSAGRLWFFVHSATVSCGTDTTVRRPDFPPASSADISYVSVLG
jgi:hypothetical protein